ncbi:MAG: Tungsten-containing aldehyde:ferredoxin oxidoreductase [Clostridia bacterium]|nr:Tungsten-containing aldehyde:ferredoxin oxidoreductase [Clostridia bacterium]
MESKYGGYMGKVMMIDLTTQQTKEYPWSDRDRELYLGGKIMAAKILYDNIQTNIEALSPENMMVITTGPLTGTGAPSSSRFNISTISPLTGFIASSNCGGNFGMALKKAGYDALIITGKSKSKIWIEIVNDTISFHDAESLWGKKTGETQLLLGGKTGKIVIGPAGENLVRYAAIISEERVAGRAGVGAVMGSKNLKAVTASGTRIVEVNNREKLKDINKKWVASLRKHPLTGIQLPRLGTAGLLSSMNARKMLATRNYKFGQFKDFEKVSGELLAERHLVKNKGCITCPIQCARVVEVDGKEVKGPEVETLGLLGPNIENSNIELILKWNYELDELGMDTITTGSTIAFAMELNERGMWDNGLTFGQTENLSQVFEDIAYRRGIGDILAEGSKRVSERFGGKEYAIHSKGLELAAYEPRGSVGQGLGYAVSNRGGCHLNGGYLVVMEGLGLNMDPYTTKSKAAFTMMFQDLMEAVSAGGNCLFTTYSMFPEPLVTRPNSFITRSANKLLKYCGPAINLANRFPKVILPVNLPMIPHTYALEAATGMKMNLGKFKRIGERGYNLERLMNLKLGLTLLDDSLPKRFTHELQNPDDSRTRVPLEEMKKKYYKVRGWDAVGIPQKERLSKLDL